jgi:hypothetical protein
MKIYEERKKLREEVESKKRQIMENFEKLKK